MTNLVKIENGVYSFYEGKELIVKVSSDVPIEKNELEHYRKSPIMLKHELLGDLCKPKQYIENIKPELFECVYFDGSDICIQNLKDIGWEITEETRKIIDSFNNEDFIIAKDSKSSFKYYNVEEFYSKFSEY